MSLSLSKCIILLALAFFAGMWAEAHYSAFLHELSIFGDYVERSVNGNNCPAKFICKLK